MKNLFLMLIIFTFNSAFTIDIDLEKPNIYNQFYQLEKIEKEVNSGNYDYKALVKLNSESTKSINLNTASNGSK